MFGDVGTIWSDAPQFRDSFLTGFGADLRLTIPVIVLLRIDVAYAGSQSGIKLSISGGEQALAQRNRLR